MEGETRVTLHAQDREFPGRVVISNVCPELDGGRFPIKRVVGEKVEVNADILADGHDLLSAVVLHRAESEKTWAEVPMEELGNDRWQGTFLVAEQGQHLYTIQGWIDHFKTWRRDLLKKIEAQQHTAVDLLVGAALINEGATRAEGAEARSLRECAKQISTSAQRDVPSAVQSALEERVFRLMAQYPDRQTANTYPQVLRVTVEREKARYSAWYEMFPRSCSSLPGAHGTFRDCIARLPYVAAMGFDVLYLPPIHPIGLTHRKGKNNNPTCAPEDVGSPWAIGYGEGGHKTIHSQLGSMEDFQDLLRAARGHNIEVALDLAYQCSADHPYLKEHPEWFRTRPDGTLQYAENPPKKYEDIYPINFESEDWHGLWEELKSVVMFWITQGVRIFRVDNPHTKPFPFWEWLIAEIKREYPDVLFLAEAFTRPKVMYDLAKCGFSQSYTYFAWRNTQWELTQYFNELTQTDLREFFRPNLWPNTPDILTDFLQYGGRPAFIARLILAATLGASYGIYGPAFELCENRALAHGSEEYLDSEKYQLRNWEIGRADGLQELIGRVNRIRRENSPLHSNEALRFHPVDNDQLIAYSKANEDRSAIVLVVVNLNPHLTHSGWVQLPLKELELPENRTYQMHDLLTDARYFWQGPRNYVQLNPAVLPAHIFRIRRHVRTERDFDYYL